MKVTIYDVAKRANVSTATVSKVINNSGKISDKTKRKILRIIKEMGFAPNKNASALSKKRTRTLGLLVPDISNPFFGETAKYMQEWARMENYDLEICDTDYSSEHIILFAEQLQQRSVDGLIICSTELSVALVNKLSELFVPIVFFSSNYVHGLNVNILSIDDYAGACMAVEHLIEKGHRHIGLILEQGPQNRGRLNGYQDTMNRYQLSFSEQDIVCVKSNIQEGSRAMKQLMNMEDAPTAVFGYNDLLAIGAIKQAKLLKLRVPEDVAVIGFDNTIFTEIVSPTLTSISQPLSDMAKKTIALIIEQIDNPLNAAQQIIFSPSIVKRAST